MHLPANIIQKPPKNPEKITHAFKDLTLPCSFLTLAGRCLTLGDYTQKQPFVSYQFCDGQSKPTFGNRIMILPHDCMISSARYHSYLLRFWRSSPDGQWRASLQCTQSGETLRFASLESCFQYLQQQSQTELASKGEPSSLC